MKATDAVLVVVVAILLTACAGPTPTRDGATISEQTAPRFAVGGPDAEGYGVRDGYPIGDRSTFFVHRLFLVGSQSHLDEIFEGRVIRKAVTPSRLTRVMEPAIRWDFQGEAFTLDDYLARNPATGLLIARGDTIYVERYQYGRNDHQRFTSHSMAKTVTSMLIGIAIAEGRIRSVDDMAAVYVPALAGTEYGRTSLRHLLQMSSGVRFVENYSGTDDLTTLAASTFLQWSDGGVAAVTPFNERVRGSGTLFAYASVETQGAISRRRSGSRSARKQTRRGSSTGRGKKQRTAASTPCCVITRGSDCSWPKTATGAGGRSFPPRGSRARRRRAWSSRICVRAW